MDIQIAKPPFTVVVPSVFLADSMRLNIPQFQREFPLEISPRRTLFGFSLIDYEPRGARMVRSNNSNFVTGDIITLKSPRKLEQIDPIDLQGFNAYIKSFFEGHEEALCTARENDKKIEFKIFYYPGSVTSTNYAGTDLYPQSGGGKNTILL